MSLPYGALKLHNTTQSPFTWHSDSRSNDLSDDGKLFIVLADELLTGFVELQRGDTRVRGEFNLARLHRGLGERFSCVLG